MKTFKGILKELPNNGVFVFFSSIDGNHLKGTRKIAKEYFGAIEGKCFNTMGNSYGICVEFVTESKDLKFLNAQIDTFYRICTRDKDKLFYVMCNETFNFHNYTTEDMIKAFKSKLVPNNIVWEESFYNVLQNGVKINVQPKTKIIDDEI